MGLIDMKFTVAFGSMTGHCKKIANAVATALDVTPVNVKNESSDLIFADVLVVVSGLYGGKILNETKDFLNSLEASQAPKVLLIMSGAGDNFSDGGIKDILTAKGIEIVGETFIAGSFLFMKFRRPNKSDIEKAVDFVLESKKQLEIQG